MNRDDPLARWRANPFYVLGIDTGAPRAEVERAGQLLLALLAVGKSGSTDYATPLGPAARDDDAARQALATLRDPNERVIEELWAAVALGPKATPRDPPAEPWEEAALAVGWKGPWAE
jgi:hypothetical protein